MYETEDLPEHLSQGDVFSRFEGAVLPRTDPEAAGFLVLTYTCDLVRPDDISYVCICPVFKLDTVRKALLSKHKAKSKKNREAAIANHLHDLAQNKKRYFFFLSPPPNLGGNPLYADLGQVFSVSKRYISHMISQRCCSLRSPWREKLGFMLGYLYNRVATEDIQRDAIADYLDTSRNDE